MANPTMLQRYWILSLQGANYTKPYLHPPPPMSSLLCWLKHKLRLS